MAAFCVKIRKELFYMSQRKTLLRSLLIAVLFGTAVFGFMSLGAHHVFAQEAQLQDVGTAAGINTGNDLYTIIGSIINVFFGILGIIFLILVLYAGFLWMTAGGDSEKIDKAKKIIVNGVIGLLITLSAFAITNFIFNALEQAGLINGGGGTTPGISVEPLSGSLGGGAIRDHYPDRNATDVPRNTKIFVTFRDQMNIESFISGYNTAGTPLATSDDVVSTTLNVDNVKIYVTGDGVDTALTPQDVDVAFTSDLKTFTFDPPVLGSATQNVNYTVVLSDQIESASGQTPVNVGGYMWTFTVGTELDLTPPTVTSVVPRPTGSYDRNIVVEVNFSEAVDPTAATGSTADGFENITVLGDASAVDGSYEISNGYRTVTFVTTDACGTNSCGETIYCLPGDAAISATIYGATPGAEPPQAVFPYNGVVDVVGNSLDGDGDWGQAGGEVGDDFVWTFNTTNDINLAGPEIESVTPNINAENIDLDQDLIVTFGCAESNNPNSCNSVLMSSSVTADTLVLTSDPAHELWHTYRLQNLNDDGDPVLDPSVVSSKTRVSVNHGIFLESTDQQTYQYMMSVNEGVRNQYQNCYAPAQGPDAFGGRCGTTPSQPFCCNGSPSSSVCPSF